MTILPSSVMFVIHKDQEKKSLKKKKCNDLILDFGAHVYVHLSPFAWMLIFTSFLISFPLIITAFAYKYPSNLRAMIYIHQSPSNFAFSSPIGVGAIIYLL